MSSQNSLEDLLSVVTDALIAEQRNIDPIIKRSEVSPAEVDGFVRLVRRLHRNLVVVQPSPRFVQKLKQDLVGTKENTLMARVRGLPPRVRVAAGIVAVAGFMLLTRRRLTDLATIAKEEEEVRVTQ